MRTPQPTIEPVSVRETIALARDLDLEVVNPAHAQLDRTVATPKLQRPGLALAGRLEQINADRLQVLGASEIQFLQQIPRDQRDALDHLCAAGVPAMIVAGGAKAPESLLQASGARGVPLLRSVHDATHVMDRLSATLAVRLAPRVRMHGVLIDMYGLGVLILGESGIGKSECALELISRGHRLVADDSVEIRLIEDELVGSAPELSRHLIEVRGLGIINARQMFGISAVRETKAVNLAVSLEPLKTTTGWERLGNEPHSRMVLGQQLAEVRLPVAPGRNLAVLLEIAARRHLLLAQGHDAAGQLTSELSRRLSGDEPARDRD